MPRDGDSSIHGKLRLTDTQRAALDGVRLSDLLKALVAEVRPQSLASELTLGTQQLHALMQFGYFVDNPTAGFFEAVRTSFEIEGHLVRVVAHPDHSRDATDSGSYRWANLVIRYWFWWFGQFSRRWRR